MIRLTRSVILALLLAAGASAQTQITAPGDYFGFDIGSDRRLLDWKQIHEYFEMLDTSSGRMQVKELGKTTQGRPFIMAVISSEETMNNLEHYQKIQQQLANPYRLDDDAAASLIAEGKVVVMLSMNIHSTEIASSQESVELAWELLSRSDEQVSRILDKVIILLIPSLNPDGQQMVTDWYRKYAGTPCEGSPLPTLYHPYAGHDNNRDWFFFNLQESRLTAEQLYREWHPEIVFDQHQMGSSGPRMFLPPYSDPVNLNVHPELMAEVNRLGKHVIADLQAQGFTGVTSDMGFNAYFEGTMSKTPLWHNMVGILSEMASVQVASPLYFPRGSLGAWGPERAKYAVRTDFLEPWPGGWWRLRDIIDYEKAAVYSILDLAAVYKEKYLKNFYELNRRSIEQGEQTAPYAYIIPFDQHDTGAAEEMLKRLSLNGIAIYRARKPVNVEGKWYGEPFVIPLAQPCRPCIKDLLEKQDYPNLKTFPGGHPRRPYDYAGWTVPLQMGVEVVPLNDPLQVPLEPAADFRFSEPATVPPRADRLYFERRNIYSYGLVNDLLAAGIRVGSTAKQHVIAGENLPAGTFFVEGAAGEKAADLFEKWHVTAVAGDSRVTTGAVHSGRLRLGIYQPWTASMDEGWTRLVLDNFNFNYDVIHNREMQKGALGKKFDVIIIPSIGQSSLRSGRTSSTRPGSYRIPEEFEGGLGQRGEDALREFVESGGTLLAIGSSCEYLISTMQLPVRDVLKDVDSREFFVPGSLLQVTLDTSHQLAFGMPSTAAVRFAGHPAFRLSSYNQESRAVGWYEDKNPLLSGWLIGEEVIAGHTALAEIPLKEGTVVLYGFGVQSRAQTWGTFKLLFNAVLAGAAEKRG